MEAKKEKQDVKKKDKEKKKGKEVQSKIEKRR
jgi:hypothetical protein